MLSKKESGAIYEEIHAQSRTRYKSLLVPFGISFCLFLTLIQLFDPGLYQTQQISAFSASLENFREQLWEGRGQIRRLLTEAGVEKDLTDDQISRLPKWSQIVDLYGEDVIIVGKDECEAFRERVPPESAVLAIAGMFNTGTNYVDTQLRKNVKTKQPSLWQVPWGKHRHAQVKWNHTAEHMEKTDKSHVLPVVIIRDPFSWLQSMCKHPYAAAWRHKNHCPNLVPNEDDRKNFKNVLDSFQVMVKFDKESIYYYKSLVHLWSEWYREYLEADYPVLMIRYEDMVFQPATVLHEIADCVHGRVNEPIQYQVNTAKSHGSGTDYVKALIKTADAKIRPHNMTVDDLKFADENLDATLMRIFHYGVPTLR